MSTLDKLVLDDGPVVLKTDSDTIMMMVDSRIMLVGKGELSRWWWALMEQSGLDVPPEILKKIEEDENIHEDAVRGFNRIVLFLLGSTQPEEDMLADELGNPEDDDMLEIDDDDPTPSEAMKTTDEQPAP